MCWWAQSPLPPCFFLMRQSSLSGHNSNSTRGSSLGDDGPIACDVMSSECDHLEKLHVWTSPELLCGLWTHVASSRQYLGNQILSVRLRHIRLPLLKDWGLEWHMGIFLSIQILRRKKNSGQTKRGCTLLLLKYWFGVVRLAEEGRTTW